MIERNEVWPTFEFAPSSSWYFYDLDAYKNQITTEVLNSRMKGGVYEKMIENSTAVTCMMAVLEFLHETLLGQVQILDCFNQWVITYLQVTIQFPLLS